MTDACTTVAPHRTAYRVIYGDTDRMGVAYYANYLRWFEIGRNELLREAGVPYKEIEGRGIMLPVAEATCKYMVSAAYDDELIIETGIDFSVRARLKLVYTLYRKADMAVLAVGHTLHACLGENGKVIRPPTFLVAALKKCCLPGGS